jgi:hypothetical protein
MGAAEIGGPYPVMRNHRERGVGSGRQRLPSEQARRHRRRRAWPVVTLALEKPLFRNVPRKRPVVTLLGKKL